MKAKKLLSILLATVLLSSVAAMSACGDGSTGSAPSSTPTPPASSANSSSVENSSSSEDSSSSVDSSSDSSSYFPEIPVETERFEDSTITFCENGTSSYRVLKPTGASAALEWAVNELITYVEKATGAKLKAVDEATLTTAEATTTSHFISIGETELFKKTGTTVTQAELTTDGYKIINQDNTVFICGPTDWGTSFGALEFLHHQVGYEAYTADEIVYETSDVLMLKDFGTYIDIPAFEGRSMDGIANYDYNTAHHNRLVGVYGSGEARFGGNKRKHWIPGPDHTIHAILPEAKYGHLYNPSQQMCFSNEEVFDAMYENLIRLIQENPEGYIVNIGAEDGKTYCACETCAGQTAKYGISGYFIRYLNRLITKIEEWKATACPDRYLIYCTFAYGGTLAPPTDEVNGEYVVKDPSCIPHEKLYVKITGTTCVMHTMDNPNCSTNVNHAKYFYGWSSICPRLMVWDYAANYLCYLPFHNDIDHIQSSYAFYKEMGVINIFTEMNSGGSITSFGFLREYLRAKCLWNPDQNIEELIDNFFEAYYKDAEPLMRQVFDLYRSHFRALDYTSINGHQGINTLVTLNTTLWPRNVVDSARALLEQALVVCDNMADEDAGSKVRIRVEEELVCLELLQVLFYDDYGYDMNKRAEFINAFEQKTLDMNITHYREHESMAAFLAGRKK